MKNIPLIDLKSQQNKIRKNVENALSKVLDHGQYVMGPEVFELEEKLADFSKRNYVVTCASGTDALYMVLLAKGVGPGDAVFVPAYTFAATAEVVALLGATPVFIDVDPDYFHMCPKSLAAAILDVRQKGDLSPKAIIPVDLFGQSVGHEEISEIADTEGLWILLDAAQSFGGVYKDKPATSYGLAATVSFFPAKVFGAYGDGGAIFTDDLALYELLKSIRIHGQGEDRYDNVRLGVTGRLDTFQAAVLLEKFKIFPDELSVRLKIAEKYTKVLTGIGDLKLPAEREGARSTWLHYTLQSSRRDAYVKALQAAGIGCAVYYKRPLSKQQAYRSFPVSPTGIPVCENLSKTCFSIPMHPYLSDDDLNYIADVMKKLD